MAVYCILGMGRSGTSAVSRIVNLLGVPIGADSRLVAPGPDNPRGFWEFEPFIRMNEEILRRFGGSHLDPPRLKAGWTDAPDVRRLRREARDLIAGEFGDLRTWAWKDPRASLTLPFWRSLLPDMRYIVCVRSPSEVWGSLHALHGIPRERGVALWMRYTAEAVRNTPAGPNRLVVGFDDLMADAARQVHRIATFLGPDAAADAERAAVARSVDEGLRHESSRRWTELADAGIPASARLLYLLLCLASEEEPCAVTGDDAIQAVAGEVLRDLRPLETPRRTRRVVERWLRSSLPGRRVLDAASTLRRRGAPKRRKRVPAR
jgi:hypothetical protein